MKREQHLRHRLHTLKLLNEAVLAMRSLSAHHFRLSRQALPAARAYRTEVENATADAGVQQEMIFNARPGLMLVASDLGLCGDYNTRLVQAAVKEYHHQAGGPLYCVGRRPRAALVRHDIQPKHLYPAAASVDGLPTLLLQLAQDLLDDFLRHEMGRLYVVSAQFEGAGRFSTIITQVLPIRPARRSAIFRPTHYQSYRRLTAVCAREFLYTTLHQLLLDSLASEHGMRLVAAESARTWLDETSETVRRQLAAFRRESTTQELLDIVAGSQQRTKRGFTPEPGSGSWPTSRC